MSAKRAALIQKLKVDVGGTQIISDDDLLLDAVEKYIFIKKSILPDLEDKVTEVMQMMSCNNLNNDKENYHNREA